MSGTGAFQELQKKVAILQRVPNVYSNTMKKELQKKMKEWKLSAFQNNTLNDLKTKAGAYRHSGNLTPQFFQQMAEEAKAVGKRQWEEEFLVRIHELSILIQIFI